MAKFDAIKVAFSNCCRLPFSRVYFSAETNRSMKKTKTVIGLFAAACVFVAIFTLFADAFGGVKDYPSSRGNCYAVMFGSQGYGAVPGMIVAWALLIASVVFLLVGSLLPSKLGGIVLGIGAVISLGASIAFFFAPGMFASVAQTTFIEEAPSLGVGLICTSIFGIAGGIVGLFGARTAMKE